MAKAEKELDAVALLKADHRKVEELFGKFEKARSGDRKAELARQICRELIVHATIEEEIFYPACRGKVENDLMDESHVEHDGAKVLIAEILAGKPEDDFFDAKVTVLSEMIEHHVKEEEKRGEGVFAQAKQAGLDLKELGARLARRKDELTAELEQAGARVPETRTFQGGKLTRGKPVELRPAA